MRMIFVLTAVAAAGCASQPTPVAPPIAATSAPAAAAPAHGASPSGATPASARSIDQILTDAKRQGYTVVNQNGEEQVCRTQLRAGSHLQKDTYCMTPAEYDELRRRTQDGLANTLRTTPPPQGR